MHVSYPSGQEGPYFFRMDCKAGRGSLHCKCLLSYRGSVIDALACQMARHIKLLMAPGFHSSWHSIANVLQDALHSEIPLQEPPDVNIALDFCLSFITTKTASQNKGRRRTFGSETVLQLYTRVAV